MVGAYSGFAWKRIVKGAYQTITRDLIFQWAYNNAVIELYESDDDGDTAIFQSTVMSIFGATGLLEFAADPKCPSRLYFAGLLSRSFLWMFRRSTQLPFHFSRFRGIMSRDEYRQELVRREDEIYELCLVLDSMRVINDPAIQSLYKQVLDFRHDQSDSGSKFYYECCSRLNLKLFE
jgi:hypothetical protein